MQVIEKCLCDQCKLIMFVDMDNKLIAKKPMHRYNYYIKFVVSFITLSQVATSGQTSSPYRGQDNATEANIHQSGKLAYQSCSYSTICRIKRNR